MTRHLRGNRPVPFAIVTPSDSIASLHRKGVHPNSPGWDVFGNMKVIMEEYKCAFIREFPDYAEAEFYIDTINVGGG